MDSLPGNSKKSGRKIEQVTSAQAHARKKPLGRQFKETFISGEGAKLALHHAFFDVIVPETKSMIYDFWSESMQRWMFGDSAPRRSRRSSGMDTFRPGGSPMTPYHRAYSKPTPAAREAPVEPVRRVGSDVFEMVVEDRAEAADVLEAMGDILKEFGMVSVADLKTLTGVPQTHTDQSWGWTDLRGARPQRLRNEGYLLALPKQEWLGE